MDDLSALGPGGHIDRLAGLVQRRSLFPRLVRPMFVVVMRVLGQSQPEVSFTVDQEVVKALAPREHDHHGAVWSGTSFSRQTGAVSGRRPRFRTVKWRLWTGMVCVSFACQS